MRRSITWRRVGVFVALNAGLAYSSASELIRLIPSSPTPPLTIPAVSVSAAALNAVMGKVFAAGPPFNKSTTFGELQKVFDAELAKGLAMAKEQGQLGVLIRVRVFEQTTDSGTFYSFGGGAGAALIGVGTNADAVCYLEACDTFLREGIPPAGARLTKDSGYIWVAPTGKSSYTVSRYLVGSLENRARVVLTTAESRTAYERTMTSAAVESYATQLSRRVKSAEDKMAIDRLVQSRRNAVTQVEEVEKKLGAALRKAERIAKTSATLDSIAGVLSLASTIATASASLGEDVSNLPGAPFQDKDSIRNAIEAYGEKNSMEVKQLTLRRSEFRDAATGTTLELYTIGVRYQMAEPKTKRLQP